MTWLLRILMLLRRAVWRGFQHDIFTDAKAAAYSSILTLFPALLVVASVLAASATTERFIVNIATAVGWALPPGVAATAMSYFENPQARPLRVLVSASTIMIMAAAGIMLSWMCGFRKAYQIPNEWGFWKEQGVAYFLVILSIIPMTFATALVAFGNQIETWMSLRLGLEMQAYLFLAWTLVRWGISIITGIAVLALIYHFGLPRTQPWTKVLPGAVVATLLWFLVTMSFGWYVTRFATYNVIYGPLGAAIALLVWLYMVALIVLIGAELNAVIYPRPHAERRGKPPVGLQITRG